MASGGRTMESVRWGELLSGLRRRKTCGHGRPEVESRGTTSLRERAKVARHGSRRARREALAGRQMGALETAEKEESERRPGSRRGGHGEHRELLGKSHGASREREEHRRACDAREQGASSAGTREQDKGRRRHGDGDRA